MRIRVGTVFLALALACATPAQEKGGGALDLPRWDSDAAPPFLGGGLWPDEFRPEDVVHPALVAGPDREPAPTDEESWLRFLPRGLFSVSRRELPAPEPLLVEISAEALRACDHAAADARVLDPMGLLAETQTEDLARLLAFHSEQAGVDARFLLLDTRQKLPAGADLSGLASGELGRGTVCLTVYPLGSPARARLFVSRGIAQAVSAEYLATLVNACIRDALETPDPVEQLQRFATQLSIRLFWLERAHPEVKPLPQEVVMRPLEIAPEPLSEITPAPPPVAKESTLQFVWRCCQPFIGLACAGVISVVIFIILFRRWLRRRLRQAVWLLPDYDHKHPVHFGGPHCGGCGTSVKYG